MIHASLVAISSDIGANKSKISSKNSAISYMQI
uniref:Uncharacterized protein n=1 Tax=Arundo donax TaxID=35708 RepID=A0A0A9AD39_ARUDO